VKLRAVPVVSEVQNLNNLSKKNDEVKAEPAFSAGVLTQ